MRKVSQFLETQATRLVGVLVAVLVVNVLLQVLFRQVFSIPVTWTDEIARFAFLWMAMIAAAVQVKRKAHFAVTIIADKIPTRRALDVVICTVMLFSAVTLFVQGVRYTIMGLDKMASTVPMQMSWIYAAIPAGALLMTFFLVEMILDELGWLGAAAEAA
ncbi:MAG: TRAP transporter small permease [Propioniciclava sp.]